MVLDSLLAARRRGPAAEDTTAEPEPSSSQHSSQDPSASTTSASGSTSRSSTASSIASNASVPVVYDSKTSRVMSDDWKTFEYTDDLIEAEADGTSMTADLKINIGSALKPIFAHYAYVDLSDLRSDVKRERKMGRIKQMFVRI